jgi:hypothetical protein
MPHHVHALAAPAMSGIQDSLQQFVGCAIQIVGFIEQQGRVSGVDTVIDRSGRNGVGSLAPGRQLLGEIEQGRLPTTAHRAEQSQTGRDREITEAVSMNDPQCDGRALMRRQLDVLLDGIADQIGGVGRRLPAGCGDGEAPMAL